MTRLRDTIDRTPEYVNFIKELKQFHVMKGTTLQAEPVLGGRRLDLYKIFQVVAASGGFDEVTKNRGWKQVGDIFQFPSTCTNSAYILKGVYIRNLLGWEEEKLWSKDWQPPKELLGPGAHKSSTLAGKAYKVAVTTKKPAMKSPSKKKKSVDLSYSNPLLFDFSNMDMDPPIYATTQDQLKHENHLNHPTPTAAAAVAAASSTVTDGNTFNEKDRILFALQFGQRCDVDWALDEIVHMSFECPEKLELTESPFLLQLLLSLAQPCLTSHAADHALPSSATDTLNDMMNTSQTEHVKIEPSVSNKSTEMVTDDFSIMVPLLIGEINGGEAGMGGTLEIILKVLHILRNFSFLATYIPILAKHGSVKEMLVQGLETSMSTGHVELGRHSMDVLENIAAHMALESEKDPCLHCVHTLVAAHDRYLVIGSIRTLTWFTMNRANHAFLESSPVMARIAQMLLSNDEELVGTALEYIYQHTRTSLQSRSQFLTSPHSSAYIGLLISLLMTKSKYFCSRFIQDDLLPSATTTTATATTNNNSNNNNNNNTTTATGNAGAGGGFLQQDQPVVPRVPDLTVYQKLDEPFRCLGWLKDKFQVADRSSVLSLDDIYLLYEARFGLEKALKMRDFYTVMKIAFPKASTTSEAKPLLASPGQSSPVVEGLNILGIQIKMSILQDRPQVSCKWAHCSLLFDDTFTLQRHVLHDHMVATANDDYACHWSHCTQEEQLFPTKDDWISHLRTHFFNGIGESCCNSPVQSPEPSLSSSPSTPTSNISSSNSSSMYTPQSSNVNGGVSSPVLSHPLTVDVSDIQGIALVASHLLVWLSKDPQSTTYFIPYEKELTTIAEQRPKLASHIWSICSNFKHSSSTATKLTC